MKLKLDENLPHHLTSTLGALGHDVHTVYEENLTGHVDAEIWDSAQREGRFLLTQDLDFLTRENSSQVVITVSCSSV